MGKKAPKSPDPAATAAAQGLANKEAVQESARVNRFGTITPYGSTTWEVDPNAPGNEQYAKDLAQWEKDMAAYNASAPTTPQNPFDPNSDAGKSWAASNPTPTRGPAPVRPTAPSDIYNQRQVTRLSPAEQAKLDQENAVSLGLGQRANRLMQQISTDPFSYSGMSEVPIDYNDLRKSTEDSVYGRLTRNLDRDFGRSEETLRSRLAAQGISQGSEAFKREMEAFNDSRNTALNNAAQQAYQSGFGESNNAFNQAVQNRNRQIAEALQLRQMPMNELSAIIQGTPAFNVSAPAAPSGGQYAMQPADVQGAINTAYQGQLNAANQRASKLGSTIGNLGQIGATIAMSDIALKENIIPLGQENGHNVYEFSYKGEPGKYIGVMAQEVMETHPEAVKEIDGYLAVDYKAIGVEFREVPNA